MARRARRPEGTGFAASAPQGRSRVVALALLLLALVAGPLAAPALAHGRQGLVDRSHFEDRSDSGAHEPHPFWEESCDVRVRQTSLVSGVESVFRDGTLVLHLTEQHHWYDFDSGRLLLAQKDREVLIERPVSDTVDERAGTRTVVLEVDYAGVPLRLMKPQGGVVLITAGLLERVVTLVFDLQSGELLSEDIQVSRVAGPHPYLGPTGSLEFDQLLTFVCDQLSA